MATSSVRWPLLQSGEERYQMLELNRRLESYLGHVKLLEEENQALWGEIQALKRSRDTSGRRQVQEEALRLARKEVQAVWMEKDHAELEVSKLLEEVEEVNAQRQRVRAAQAEAKRRLEESRRELEDERRAQIWLKEQAAHLEKEVSLQEQVHQEDIAALKSSYALYWKQVPVVPQKTQASRLQGLGEEYSQQAAQVWQEAADAYQRKVAHLEENLDQARARMAQITQEKREKQLQVQDLAKELMSMKTKRDLLEKNTVQLRDRQNQELQYLQTQVQALEAEKGELGVQIDELLVDRHNLLQMKMSLGLEVATYRALLDAESLRVGQSANRTSARTTSLLDTLPRPRGTRLDAQTISTSCQFSTLLTTTPRSMAHSKENPMSPAPSLTWITPQETPERAKVAVEENVCISEETIKLEGSSTAVPPTDSSHLFNLEDANEDVRDAASGSASPVPPAADEPDSMLGAGADVQEVLPESQAEDTEVMCSSDEAAVLSSAAGHVTNPAQMPEMEASHNLHSHAEPGKGLEDEEEEESEVSAEMARITQAPTFAWEGNDAVVPEENEAASETELDTDSISEHHPQEVRTDTTSSGFKEHSESTDEVASALLAETTWHSVDAFSHIKKSGEMLWVDEQEIVSNFPAEESLEIENEIKKESTDKWEGIERSAEEKTEVASSGPEVWAGCDAVTVMQIEENRTDKWEGMERSEDAEEETEATCTEVWVGYGADSAGQEEVNQTESEAEDRKVESKEVEIIAEDVGEKEMTQEDDIIEETFANTGKEVMTQDPFAPEVDPHGSVEYPEDTAEWRGVELFDDDLVEENAEQQQRESDEDVSFNVCASWRTDHSEADSYTQENTLADTRPLIHYKSDEETDANTQVSHVGVSEPSDSEDERERHDGVGPWSQTASKRFDTMEDLSEEPEMDNPDDPIPNSSVQTVKEGPVSLGESMETDQGETHCEVPVPLETEGLESESGDIDRHVSVLTDDALVHCSESDLQNKSEGLESESEDVDHHVSVLTDDALVHCSESDLQNMSEGLERESGDVDHHVSILTDDALVHCSESDLQNKSEGLESKSGDVDHHFSILTDDALVHCSESDLQNKSEGLESESVDIDHHVSVITDDAVVHCSESDLQNKSEGLESEREDVDHHVSVVTDDALVHCSESDLQNMSEGLERESGDVDHHVSVLTDDALVHCSEIDLQNKSEGLESKSGDVDHCVSILTDDALVHCSESDLQNKSEGLERESGDVDHHISVLTDDAVVHCSESDLQNKSEGLERECGDVEHHVSVLTDDAVVHCSESDLQYNCEENAEEENNHIFLAEKQKERSHEYGLSESFYSETWEITEQKYIPAKQLSSTEDEPAITSDNKEPPSMESVSQNETEGESLMKTKFENLPFVTDTPLPDTFDEEAQVEEPCEMSQKEPTHSDVFPFETAMTKEQACPKQENDEKSNLPVFTHADFTDNLSLYSELSSQPDSQTNIAELDLEESNSSGDESPNSSQCSQYFTQAGQPAEEPLTDLLEEMGTEGLGENSFEDFVSPQTDQNENVGSRNNEEEEDEVKNSSSGTVENHNNLSEVKEQQDLNQSDETIGASHTAVEKLGEMPTMDDKASVMMDIFQGKFLSEESLTKENDPHSFFTSSINEGAWSTVKFEMAATNDPAEPERFSHDTIHPNQSMMFEEDWGDVGSLPPANGKPDKEIDLSLTQSDGEKEREEEQRIPKAKQLQCTDVREGEALTVQSDVSTDDGDSWSSGEE